MPRSTRRGTGKVHHDVVGLEVHVGTFQWRCPRRPASHTRRGRAPTTPSRCRATRSTRRSGSVTGVPDQHRERCRGGSW